MNWIKRLFKRRKKVEKTTVLNSAYSMIGQLEETKKKAHKQLMANVRPKEQKAIISECNKHLAKLRKITG
jgi:galactose-1-phosphate uridylyltransferase